MVTLSHSIFIGLILLIASGSSKVIETSSPTISDPKFVIEEPKVDIPVKSVEENSTIAYEEFNQAADKSKTLPIGIIAEKPKIIRDRTKIMEGAKLAAEKTKSTTIPTKAITEKVKPIFERTSTKAVTEKPKPTTERRTPVTKATTVTPKTTQASEKPKVAVQRRRVPVETTKDETLNINLPPSEFDPNVSPNFTPSNITDLIIEDVSQIPDAEPTVVENPENQNETGPVNVDDVAPINKFCKCAETSCNCCRDLFVPFIPVRAPGCAKIQYLGNEKMAVTIKYGDIVLASRTISGKNAPPICMPLPGGFNHFCGKVYGLSKEKDDFKACLGFELRAEDEVEASLRVSCFKFGLKGFVVSESEPLPPPENNKDDDDDDDDYLGFGGDDDEPAREEEDGDDDDEDNETEPEEDNNENNEADYDGFSLLGGGILDEILGSDTNKKKKGDTSSKNAENVDADEGSSKKKKKKNENEIDDDKDYDDFFGVGDESDDEYNSGEEDEDKPSEKSAKEKKDKSSGEDDFAIDILARLLRML